MNLDFRGEPRAGMQTRVLAELAEIDSKYVLLSAPVGSGKSHIAIAAARGAGSAFIVSSQNILLDQYAHDFRVPVVKGRSRYACKWAGGMNCEKASEIYEEEHLRNCRDYIPARHAFWHHRISVTNLHFLQFAQAPSNAVDHRSLLVVDECHNLEPMLLDLYRVAVLREDCLALGIGFHDDFPRILHDYVSKAAHVRDDDGHFQPPQIPITRAEQRQRIRTTATKIERVNLLDTENPWHVDHEQDAITFRPLFARNLAGQLLGMADKVLFMSATPGGAEHFFRNLGITDKSKTAFVEVESDFPKGKGIVLPPNSLKIYASNFSQTTPSLARSCAAILRQPDAQAKGLILFSSYKLAEAVFDLLQREFGNRLLIHNSKNRAEVVAKHRDSKQNTVLFAVNMHEGLDLNKELARFLLIPKVLSPVWDAWTRERNRLDPGYYDRISAGKMVQACGRVIRGPDDWSYILIFDACILDLIAKAAAEFPKYFHKAFEVRDYID